jgi:ribosome biogenesis SPOUT family RNA methylase Rps3
MKIVIENLEPLGKWVLYEYEHSYEAAGDLLLITNAKIDGLPSTERRFFEVFDPKKVVILDPKAPEELKPEDFDGIEAVVIGGILGDHPPKGRTWELLTSEFPQAKARNLGKLQLPIDNAVLVTKLIMEGKRLSEIRLARGLKIECEFMRSKEVVILPFGYVIYQGRPFVSEKVLRLAGFRKGCKISWDLPEDELAEVDSLSKARELL